MPPEFPFNINAKAVICLAGLSPAETLELEELLFHDGTPSAAARLKELCDKHEGAEK
jgi:hypothetical protein